MKALSGLHPKHLPKTVSHLDSVCWPPKTCAVTRQAPSTRWVGSDPESCRPKVIPSTVRTTGINKTQSCYADCFLSLHPQYFRANRCSAKTDDPLWLERTFFFFFKFSLTPPPPSIDFASYFDVCFYLFTFSFSLSPSMYWHHHHHPRVYCLVKSFTASLL